MNRITVMAVCVLTVIGAVGISTTVINAETQDVPLLNQIKELEERVANQRNRLG